MFVQSICDIMYLPGNLNTGVGKSKLQTASARVEYLVLRGWTATRKQQQQWSPLHCCCHADIAMQSIFTRVNPLCTACHG